MSDWPEISDELGHRLAAFTDGEGHFAIIRARSQQGKRGIYYTTAFVIQQRDDDRQMLERFMDATGLGRIYHVTKRGNDWSKPANQWRFSRKEECLRLVEIFERYPLWSRKHEDFIIWARAVRYLSGPRPHGLAPVERWFNEIRAVRKYQAQPVDELPEAIWSLFDLEEMASA